MAALYGLPLVASDQGGLSYARGDALVSSGPPTASKPQVDQDAGRQQVRRGRPRGHQWRRCRHRHHGGSDRHHLRPEGRQPERGRDSRMAAQVNRIVQAGATHVLAAGVWPLGQTPLGTETGQVTNLNNLTLAFNNAFKIGDGQPGRQRAVAGFGHVLQQCLLQPDRVPAAEQRCDQGLHHGPGHRLHAGHHHPGIRLQHPVVRQRRVPDTFGSPAAGPIRAEPGEEPLVGAPTPWQDFPGRS